MDLESDLERAAARESGRHRTAAGQAYTATERGGAAVGKSLRTILRNSLRLAVRSAGKAKGKPALDLCHGTGQVSQKLRNLGRPVLVIDATRGPHMNLAKAEVYNLLAEWIKAGVFCAVYSSTECSSMSRARRAPTWSQMPHRLRSDKYPAGLPHLTDQDATLLSEGNLLSRGTTLLLQAAQAQGLPVFEENPAHSFLRQWHDREK